MPVKMIKKNPYLTIHQVTKEAIVLWKNANAYWELLPDGTISFEKEVNKLHCILQNTPPIGL